MENELEQTNDQAEEIVEENAEQVEEPKRELQDYVSIEARLKEIEDKVTSEDLDMDQSLELYEEAVNLGMKASQTVENNVLVNLNNNEDSEEEETPLEEQESEE